MKHIKSTTKTLPTPATDYDRYTKCRNICKALFMGETAAQDKCCDKHPGPWCPPV